MYRYKNNKLSIIFVAIDFFHIYSLYSCSSPENTYSLKIWRASVYSARKNTFWVWCQNLMFWSLCNQKKIFESFEKVFLVWESFKLSVSSKRKVFFNFFLARVNSSCKIWLESDHSWLESKLKKIFFSFFTIYLFFLCLPGIIQPKKKVFFNLTRVELTRVKFNFSLTRVRTLP